MPNIDSQRLYGGFMALPRGVDMGTDPSLLGDGEAAFACNLSFRGDLPVTRQPWLSVPLSAALTGRFQGAAFYTSPSRNCIVVSVSGRLYAIDTNGTVPAPVTDITPTFMVTTTAEFTVPVLPAPNNTVLVEVSTEAPFATGDTLVLDSGTYTVTNRAADELELAYVAGAANPTVDAGCPLFRGGDPVTFSHTNPATLDFVYMFQAEKYLIILARQQTPLIFDGSSVKLAGPTQVPSGVLGLYAWGRLWIVLNDNRSFVAGDIVYGPSGTPEQGFVDALLYFTENDFLAEGGFFGVPTSSGDITALQALATIDTSLGIGQILVGTPNSVCSVNAPVDRTTWKNLTYPIQTISLLDYGTVGPRFSAPINNDMWYRSVDGFRSFLVARRDTNAWGNTPLSHELSPILGNDDPSLLYFGSMILFDNRIFATVVPRHTDSGVVHDGLAVINFDALSTLGGKQPPIWEGIACGLSVFQLVRGHLNGTEKACLLALNPDNDNIELWELLPEGDGFYDTYRTIDGNDSVIVRSPIATALETKRYTYDRLVELITAELYLDDIADDITLRVFWKPDQYPSWLDWTTIELCATVSQCTITNPSQFTCTVWQPHNRTYAARVLLTRPPEECNILAGIPLNLGYSFQFRFEGTGHFRLRKFRPHLRVKTDAMVGECPSSTVCRTFIECPPPWINYAIQRSVP